MPSDWAASTSAGSTDLEAGPEVFRLVDGIGEAQADDPGRQGVQAQPELRQDEIDIEQLDDDRDAAHHIDHGAAEHSHGLQPRAPHQRPHEPQDDAQQQGSHRDLERHDDPLEQDRQELDGAGQEIFRHHNPQA
nr:hypothetical protein [Phenylobacterium sp. J426]